MANNITNEILQKYARMSVDAFMDDPVYQKVAKNEKKRRQVIYHGVLIRLYDSRNNGDLFYFDEEDRGLLVLRDVNRELQFSEFLKCPNFMALFLLLPYALKLFSIIGKFDSRGVFGDDSYMISPIFVAKEHQKKGVASALVKKAAADILPTGYKICLDTQNPANVEKYEKMGFKLLKEEFYEEDQIHNYYMSIE